MYTFLLGRTIGMCRMGTPIPSAAFVAWSGGVTARIRRVRGQHGSATWRSDVAQRQPAGGAVMTPELLTFLGGLLMGIGIMWLIARWPA